ncbi:hypothetical protein MRX96_008489 [Rhipicephalus microplus]
MSAGVFSIMKSVVIREDLTYVISANGKLLQESLVDIRVGFTEEVVELECAYSMECIRKAPHNESPWNYLRGVIDAAGGGE